jgi:hypothetical protein
VARIEWIDQYSGTVYRISTTEDYGTKGIARVNSYADVVLEYEFHRSKCADADGNAAKNRRSDYCSVEKYRFQELNTSEKNQTFSKT